MAKRNPPPPRLPGQPDCYQCHGWTGALQRYEHDGKVDHFHDTCVGAWLMNNHDSVISFFVGQGEAPA